MGNLLRGLRIVRGYVQVRVYHKGRAYTKNFGPDCPLAREYGLKHLTEKRHEIRMGKFGIEKELPEKTFAEVVPFYKKMWAAEKDGDGRPAHDERSQEVCFGIIDRVLLPFLGKLKFHLITPNTVSRWREARLATGVLGTSVNREQVPLSSIFSHMEKAVNLELIEKFKLPVDTQTGKAKNPCFSVERAKMRKRERIPTEYELKKLKLAFHNLGDADGWVICQLALETVLSEKDLRKLELGATIDIERSKTGVPIHLPITVLRALNWHNWRHRWYAAKREAGLNDFQFRDFRKKGGNHLLDNGYDIESVAEYYGHASSKTTERSYKVRRSHDRMREMAECQKRWVEGL